MDIKKGGIGVISDPVNDAASGSIWLTILICFWIQKKKKKIPQPVLTLDFPDSLGVGKLGQTFW